MQDEFLALINNQTWSLVSKLLKKIYGRTCKWELKMKRHFVATIPWFKAGLLPKDITNILTWHLCSPADNFNLRQVDIYALLFGVLQEQVFVEQPPACQVRNGNNLLVCKLQKAIYGLKQSLNLV